MFLQELFSVFTGTFDYYDFILCAKIELSKINLVKRYIKKAILNVMHLKSGFSSRFLVFSQEHFKKWVFIRIGSERFLVFF